MKKTVFLCLALLVAFSSVAARPVLPSLKQAPVLEKSGNLKKGKNLELFLYHGGVYFAESAYSGKAILRRILPDHLAKLNNQRLKFKQRISEIQIKDKAGKQVKDKWVKGVIYVYFNLSSEEYKQWKNGKLAIYRFNSSTGKWVRCNTRFIQYDWTKHGRLYCIATDFGYYGLASKK